MSAVILIRIIIIIIIIIHMERCGTVCIVNLLLILSLQLHCYPACLANV